MSLTLLLTLSYLAVVLFLFLHHRLIHKGSLFSLDDFKNALWNIIKSHEGLIILATLLYIGSLTGMILVLLNGGDW